MSYADFDIYSWIPQCVEYEVSDEQAREIIKVNDALMREAMESLDEKNLPLILTVLCNKMIGKSVVLQAMHRALSKITFLSFAAGAFVKMHRSPKDADFDDTYDPQYFACYTGLDVVRLLCKSLRIADDLREYMEHEKTKKLFISPFHEPKYRNEFRIFVRDNQYLGHAACWNYGERSDFSNEEIEKACKKAYGRYKHLAPRPTYCMDVEIEANSGDNVRLFEFNPLDDTTEMYGFIISENN